MDTAEDSYPVKHNPFIGLHSHFIGELPSDLHHGWTCPVRVLWLSSMAKDIFMISIILLLTTSPETRSNWFMYLCMYVLHTYKMYVCTTYNAFVHITHKNIRKCGTFSFYSFINQLNWCLVLNVFHLIFSYQTPSHFILSNLGLYSTRDIIHHSNASPCLVNNIYLSFP